MFDTQCQKYALKKLESKGVVKNGKYIGTKINAIQQYADDNNKESDQDADDSQPKTNKSFAPRIIKLYESDIDEIASAIAEFCSHYNTNVKEIVDVLPGVSFKNNIGLDSYERLVQGFKLSEQEVVDSIKNLHNTYTKGHAGEEIPDEQTLLKILIEKSQDPAAASQLLDKVKKVLKRRNNDALSLLPEYVRDELPPNICQELQTNVVEVLSPKSFGDKLINLVIAHLSEKTISYATLYKNKKKDEKTGEKWTEYKLVRRKTIINAVPTKIVKCESPIKYTDNTTADPPKYDITFESSTGMSLNTGPSTIDGILSFIRSHGLAYNHKQIADVFNAVLNAYRREQRRSGQR
jgi:hypothetical protein